MQTTSQVAKEHPRGAIPSTHELRVLAVEASVDPRTAQKWWDGGTVSSTCAAVLEKAAVKLGWLKPEPKLFVGRTVRQIRQMLPSELEREGWEDRHKSTRVIVFTDGSLIYASQDDEGNGPGAMFGIVDGKAIRVPEE